MKFSILLLTVFLILKINSQELYNVNLLVNGDAEDLTSQVQSPGWINTFGDEPEMEAYGHTGGEYDWDWGKERGYGEGYLRSSVAKHEPKYLSQQIDVSSISVDVESGNVSYSLGGFFAAGEGASTRLEAVFKNSEGKKISSSATEHLKADEQINWLEYHEKKISGQIPKGTMQVEIVLHFEYPGECSNCSTVAVADNLSFVLNKKENK
jgi:hypothetical protein